MRGSIETRLLLTWLALAGITLLVWWIVAHRDTGALKLDTTVALGAIAIAVIKVRIIVREFMDVRYAGTRLRHITDAWLGLFVVAMVFAYFV